MKFSGGSKLVGGAEYLASGDEIANEPMIYGGSWYWCMENAGELTKRCMGGILDDCEALIKDQALRGYHPVIDTKSVLLMPGQYPCIPGWHCDGVIRHGRGEQPDLSTLGDRILHFICCISDNPENGGTEIIDSIEIPDEAIDEKSVWASVDKYVNSTEYKSWTPKSGEIVRIMRSTLHRGTQAKTRGWRYFFRLSFYHMPAMNQIRQQVQVYADPSLGW